MSKIELLPAQGSAEIEVFRGDDGEPRVSAEALAVKLGYTRPRAILATIRSLEEEGAIGPVLWRQEKIIQQTGNGASRVLDLETCDLDQRQALFVAARSRTANAVAVTKLVIEVFLAVQRAELQQASPRQLSTSNYERLLSEVSKRLEQQKEQIDRQGKQIDRLLAHQTRQQNTPKAQPKQLPQSAPQAQTAQRSLSLPQGGQHAAPSPREHREHRAGVSAPSLLRRLSCIEWDDRALWWPSEIVIVLREHLERSYHTDAIDRAAWRLGWLDSYGDARIDVPAIVASRSVGAKGRITYRVRAQYAPVLLAEFGRGLL